MSTLVALCCTAAKIVPAELVSHQERMTDCDIKRKEAVARLQIATGAKEKD